MTELWAELLETWPLSTLHSLRTFEYHAMWKYVFSTTNASIRCVACMLLSFSWFYRKLWKVSFFISFISFLVVPLLPTHCRCRRLPLHLFTLGWTPLDKGSARRRGLYLHNTQHSQETKSRVPIGMRTHNPSPQTAADLRFRSRGHQKSACVRDSSAHLAGSCMLLCS